MGTISGDKLNAIRIDYEANIHSIRSLAKKHNVSESFVRKKASALGWIRSATSKKREIVAGALATGKQPNVADAADSTEAAIMDEASQDLADMQRGLHNARTAMIRLEKIEHLLITPKIIKEFLEANKLAVETIRRIRGLDEERSNNYEDTLDYIASEFGWDE